MSVIIKGMKIPDSCASCQFCLDGILDDHDEPCTACELIADNTPWGCGYKIIDGIDYDKERMYFCPLTPLPEHHGRLIDADAIYNEKECEMFNDWRWVKYDNSEYRLKNASDEMVAYLVRNYDDRWFCRIYNDDWNINFSVTFEGLKNTEEVIWQATLWINNTCNQIANSFHHIRDHLPSLRELREQAEKISQG